MTSAVTAPRPMILAIAGVLIDGDRFLLTERPREKLYGGYWEFPGGKPEAGETPEVALVRELDEELGIAVDPAELRPLSFLSHAYPEYHVLLPIYTVHRWQGTLVGREGQRFAWLTLAELATEIDQGRQLLPTAHAMLALIAQYLAQK